MSRLNKAREELRVYASAEKASFLQRFFKTGPGEYAQGDVFIGVKVPDTRKIAKKHHDLSEADCRTLLQSEIHEERLLALLLFIARFEKGDAQTQENIYRLYCNHTAQVNNWDLVDISAHRIVGAYLANRNKQPLYMFARSENLWERRIAIIATFNFIKNGCLEESIKIAEILLADPHDLIHKAVGWVLREAGKQDELLLDEFIRRHYVSMPRTMLRYAIEKFPKSKRKLFLHGKFD